MLQELPTFFINDQPTTCPYCGSRCDELANFMHTKFKSLVAQCLNENCQFIFYEEDDEYAVNLLKMN